jgi:undecaprenyl-diphosphatase
MLAYLVVLTRSALYLKVCAVALASGLVLAIGFSRLYLGVHYLSDVLAGYAAGVVWLSACISGFEVLRRRTGIISWAKTSAAESGPPQSGRSPE